MKQTLPRVSLYLTRYSALCQYSQTYRIYLENLLISLRTLAVALRSIALYRTRTSCPNSVTRAPPPRLPPVSVSTKGETKQLFIVSTRIHALRYYIPNSRAAAEIEPVFAIESNKAALPGPIAIDLRKLTFN